MRLRGTLLPMLVGPLLLVTGCVGIPSESLPRPVAAITEATPSDSALQVAALGPQGGEQPDEIVRGFLAASASTVRSRPSARLYLTPEAAQSWADDDGVTVISSDVALVPASAGRQVTLASTVLGRVDTTGVYAAADEALSLALSLELVDGQWRIGNPPPGVLLRLEDFTRAYVSYNLYFLDPTGTRVVPDPRFFLAGSAARANSLVEKLLDGPSPFLADAVRSELSPGVSLLSNVQEVRDVEIDLTGLGERSPASLQGLSAQLIWTLKQASISELTLRSDGQPLSVPGAGGVQTSRDWQSYGPDVIPADDLGHFVSGGGVWTTDGVPLPGPAGQPTYNLVSAGVSSGQQFLAGVSSVPGGANLLIGGYGEALAPVLSGRSFAPPVWVSLQQELWTVRDGTEVIRVPGVGATPQTITFGGLDDGETIRSLQISRDGTRAAIVSGADGAGELSIATVVRSGTTVELARLTRLSTGLRNVVDVSWAASTQLLFLATDPADGSTKPWTISIDGAVLNSLSIDNLFGAATSIAAAPGRPALVSAAGTMYQLDGAAWTTLVRGLPFFPGSEPSYPG